MNKVCLIGRTTKDIELKGTPNGSKYAKFTLAVNRGFSKEPEKQTADFISCIAWNQTAEFLNKYIKKGNRLGIVGKIQTGSYEDSDGKKIYTTDIVVEHTTLLETKKENEFKPSDPYDAIDLPF